MNVADAIFEQIVENGGIYEPMNVPGGLNCGAVHDVRTFGVRATSVSSDMMRQGLTVPMCEGARQYFEQAGVD